MGEGAGSAQANKARFGWLALIIVVLVATCMRTESGKRQHRAEVAAKQVDEAHEAEVCRIERSRSESDAIAECESAASLFGQDISDNPERLSQCVEVRESKLKACTAHEM